MRHLPGVRLHAARDERGNMVQSAYETLTTACGKRGAIKTRESAGNLEQAHLFDERRDEGVCPECLVLWDRAEESGALLPVWNHNGKEAWKGPGAVVWTEEPRPWRCGHCSEATARWRAVGCFAAVVRK